MRFRGRLKLPGERGEGVVVDIRLDDIFLEVMAGAEELGRWRMDDVTIERLVSNEFALNLDGEPVVFIADDALAFAYEGVAAIGDVAARLTKKRRGLRRRSPEVTDGARMPAPVAPAPPAEQPAGRPAGGGHRPVEQPSFVESPVETPAAVASPAPIEPPAFVESPVETPAAVASPAPIESPAFVESPVETPAAVASPAPIEQPAAVASPAPIEPPASVESPVETPAAVAPPAPIEQPAAVAPPAPIEPPAAVEPPPVNVPTAGETPGAGEPPAGFVPRSPWIVPDDGATDGDGADGRRRSADPAPPDGDPVSPWIVPEREEAPGGGAGPVVPEVFPTVADEEGAGTFAAEVAVIDLTEPFEPGDAIESDGEDGETTPLAVVLPLHPVPPVVVSEHPAAVLGKSAERPAPAGAGSTKAADATVPSEAPAEVRARPARVAPQPAEPAARREVERGGLFGRRRARSPEPHEHTYEEGGTVGGITRRVCTVCGHVSFLGADVYEGWQ